MKRRVAFAQAALFSATFGSADWAAAAPDPTNDVGPQPTVAAPAVPALTPTVGEARGVDTNGRETRPSAAASSETLLGEASVVEQALADHAAVQIALEAKRAAEAGYDGTQLARVPQVTVLARYTRLSSIPVQYRNFGGAVFPQLLDQLGVRAELSVPITNVFLGLAAASRAAGRDVEAREIEIVSTRVQIAYEARVAFLQYWSTKLALENADALVRAAESNVTDQRNRYEAGTVAQNDLLEFEVALDAAILSRHAVEADLVGAEAALRVFLPRLEGKKITVAASLETTGFGARTPAAPPLPPQLASLEAQGKAAEERAEQASLERLPSLSLYAAGDVSAPSPRVFVLSELKPIPTWEAGARLEWSLGQFAVGGARAAQARSEYTILLNRLTEARRKLEAERAGATGALALTAARIERAQQRVERASALALARRGELDAGTALPINVVKAETDLATAKNEHLAAVVARALSIAKVDFLDGRTAPTAEVAR